MSKFLPKVWDTYHTLSRADKSEYGKLLFEHIDTIRAPKHMDYDANALDRAVIIVKNKFMPKTKQPIWHFNDVVSNLSVTNTSPGSFYKKLGCRTKQDAIDNHLQQLRRFQHFVKYSNADITKNARASIAFTPKLSQKPKLRTIMVYPIEILLPEMMFSQPIIHWFKRAKTPYRLGMTTDKLYECIAMKQKLDVTSFDAYTPTVLIKRAFDLVEDSLDFSRYDKWGKPDQPTALVRAFRRLRKYFCFTPFEHGNIRDVLPGIPSGSSFTGIIGSLVNAILIEYSMIKCGVKTSYYVYGDDAVLTDKITPYHADFGYIVKDEEMKWLGYRRVVGKDLGLKWKFEDAKLFAAAMRPLHPDRTFGDAYLRVLCLRNLTRIPNHAPSNFEAEATRWLESVRCIPKQDCIFDRELVKMLMYLP